MKYENIPEEIEDLTTFQVNLLKTHNDFRKKHGSPPLTLNKNLERKARECAEEAARTNTLKSIELTIVGQNMIGLQCGILHGHDVSRLWYEEEASYDYRNPKFNPKTGSFTQMIWKNTKEIGVSRSFGKNGETFVVALYYPAGNIKEQYGDNIQPPHEPLCGDYISEWCNCTIL